MGALYWGSEADQSQLRMSGTIPPLPHIPLWYGQGQLYPTYLLTP